MGEKSSAQRESRTITRPSCEKQVPLRATRVASTQSNMSTPRIMPSIRQSGEPTPIR